MIYHCLCLLITKTKEVPIELRLISMTPEDSKFCDKEFILNLTLWTDGQVNTQEGCPEGRKDSNVQMNRDTDGFKGLIFNIIFGDSNTLGSQY